MARETTRGKQAAKRQPTFTKVRIAALIVVGVFLLLAQSAFWVQRDFFNGNRFSEITTTTLTTSSSRTAIAQEIVSQALGSRPTLEKFVSKPATSLISGLLNTGAASDTVQFLSDKVQSALTSSHRQSITLNLAPIKGIVAQVVSLASRFSNVSLPASASVKASQIPDQITLVNKSSIPPLYTYGLIILWVGWACLVAAVALIIWLLYKARAHINVMVIACGLSLVGASIVGLILEPLIRPLVVNLGPSLSVQTLIGNIYDGFLSDFSHQLYLMGAIGIIAIIVGWVTTSQFKAAFAGLIHHPPAAKK